MEKIIYDNPPLKFRETDTSLQRASDVVAAAESANNFSPMTKPTHERQSTVTTRTGSTTGN